VIYSPSTIGFSASTGDGGTAPIDTSSSGTSMFLAYLHQQGYPVYVANTTTEVWGELVSGQKLVYLLVGADTALESTYVKDISSGYKSGQISLLIAEGNTTNSEGDTTNSAMLSTLGASVTRHAITDPTSFFVDQRVFTIEMRLPNSSSPTEGLIDIASPITLNSSSTLKPVATTSFSSTDSGNVTEGPRTVVAAGTSTAGARAIVLSDSAPFTNFLFNYTDSQEGIDEKGFVSAMLNWVDPGKNTTILFDASLYSVPKPPKYEAGLPIGPLVTYSIEQSLSGLNSYYSSLPSQVSGFLGSIGIPVSDAVASVLIAVLLLVSVYGAITRWLAPEGKGKDDLPQDDVEQTVVAQSKARADFLRSAHSKAGYLAAMRQLYDVLDSMVEAEFGSGISKVEEGTLAARIGAYDARQAMELFRLLSRLREYAIGQRKFLFPPVLRWSVLTSRVTSEAEAFLNLLGMTTAAEVTMAEERRKRRGKMTTRYLPQGRIGA
jgi:hypothetical protein